MTAEYFAREGIVYIGVTTSGNTSIPFLRNGCGGLNPPCGTRYQTLLMSDNGQEYDQSAHHRARERGSTASCAKSRRLR